MSRAPFLKLFFSDLVGDTLGLSDAEFGSYMLLLGAMWNDGESLPADPPRLARIARCSPKVWHRRWAVLSQFFDQAGGVITNARLLKERQKVDQISAERSAAGKLGAEAKALKTNNSPEANASANAKQPEPEPENSVRAPETPDQRAWRDAVQLLTGAGRMKEAAARSFFGKLLKESRLQPYQLAPSILSAALKGTQDPQGFLKAAARGIGSAGTTATGADVSTWGVDVWRTAVSRFNDGHGWDVAVMGPKPGQPGCLAPPEAMEAA